MSAGVQSDQLGDVLRSAGRLQHLHPLPTPVSRRTFAVLHQHHALCAVKGDAGKANHVGVPQLPHAQARRGRGSGAAGSAGTARSGRLQAKNGRGMPLRHLSCWASSS